MAKKTLLTEGEFKKFMKLARLEPLAAEKLSADWSRTHTHTWHERRRPATCARVWGHESEQSATFTILRKACTRVHFYRFTRKAAHFYATPTLIAIRGLSLSGNMRAMT